MTPSRRHWLRTAAAGTSALLFDGGVHSGQEPVALAQRAQAVPLEYFGLHIHDPKTPWPAYRFGRLRLWDTRTSWFHLQPERDRWDFSRLDDFVQQASQRGVVPVLPLGMTPTWAAARPTEKSPYNVPGAASEPADIAHWRAYVQTVAKRYKGRVRNYEIWNEVNSGAGFFTGSVEAMFDLQRTAYEVLKAVDPGITVISPSTEGSTEDKFVWFERYMRLMAGRFADVVAYHFYIPRKAPEALLPVVQRVQAIMARTGNDHLPLWNTESGYRVDWGSSAPLTGTWGTWPNLPPERAAAWLVRSYLLGWLAGLDSFFWYAYDSGVMGMVPSSRDPSVVSAALGQAIKHLVSSTVDQFELFGQIASVRVRRNDFESWWAWTIDDGETAWEPPNSWACQRAIAMNDTPVRFIDGKVLLTGSPVRLLR